MAGGSHTGFYINGLRSSSGFYFLLFPLLSLSVSVEFEWATLSKNSKTFHRMLDGVVIFSTLLVLSIYGFLSTCSQTALIGIIIISQ